MIPQTQSKILKYSTFDIKISLINEQLFIQVTQPENQNKFTPSKPSTSSFNNNFVEQSIFNAFKLQQQKRIMKQQIVYRAKLANAPSGCEMCFKNIYEVYNTFQNKAVSITQTSQGIQLVVNFIIRIKQFNISKKFTIPLQKTVTYHQNQQPQRNWEINKQSRMQEEEPVQKFTRKKPRLYQSHDQKSLRQAMYTKQQPSQIQIFSKTNNFSNMAQEIQKKFMSKSMLYNQSIKLQFKCSSFVKPELVYLNYIFSNLKKSQSIQLITYKSAISKAFDNNINCILIDPCFQSPIRLVHQHYQINFKIKNNPNCTAVGICQKQVVRRMGYQYHIASHNFNGCYVLQQNGYVLSCFRNEGQPKKYQNLAFKAGDLIKVRYCTKDKIVKFVKNNELQNCIQVQINPKVTIQQLNFCAFLCGMDDQIEIIQTNKDKQLKNKIIRNRKRSQQIIENWQQHHRK